MNKINITETLEASYLEDGDFEIEISRYRVYANEYLSFEDIQKLYNFARKSTGKSSDVAKDVDED